MIDSAVIKRFRQVEQALCEERENYVNGTRLLAYLLSPDFFQYKDERLRMCVRERDMRWERIAAERDKIRWRANPFLSFFFYYNWTCVCLIMSHYFRFLLQMPDKVSCNIIFFTKIPSGAKKSRDFVWDIMLYIYNTLLQLFMLLAYII